MIDSGAPNSSRVAVFFLMQYKSARKKGRRGTRLGSTRIN